MSLETHIAGSEDRLIDGLHFAGRNTASYLVNRRDATFHPSSASNFKPSGVRLMRWSLADQAGWLDGNSVRLIFTLNNLAPAPSQGQAVATNAIWPITDTPAGMFRRLRILGGWLGDRERGGLRARPPDVLASAADECADEQRR